MPESEFNVIRSELGHLSKLIEDQNRESREHREKIVKLLTQIATQSTRIENLESFAREAKEDIAKNAERIAAVSGAIKYASGAAAVVASVVAFRLAS